MDRVGFNKRGEILVYKSGKKVMRITLEKDHISFYGRWIIPESTDGFKDFTEKERTMPMTYKANFRDIKVIRLGEKIIPLAKKEKVQRLVVREFLAACYYTKTDVSSQCSGAVDCIMRLLRRRSYEL